jgi:arylsulfatase A-like enzyme
MLKSINKDLTVALYKAIIMAGLILYLSINGCSVKRKFSSPNFVFILTDNQGYGDVGCFGAEGFETPNLDQMAEEGIIFTDFYAAPTCTPARASLMTGCYPQRVGLPMVVRPPGPPIAGEETKLGLNPKEETIAEVLKKEGYKTACIGKWHLGHHPEHLPTNHGFDEYFGLPYCNNQTPEYRPGYPPLPLIECRKGDSIIPPDTIEINPDISKLTTIYTQRAIEFIKNNRNQPFFLYLAHTMPHKPLGVSEKFKGKSEKGLYGDVIMEIDWSVGEILKTLKNLGIDRKTFVIFASDNGPDPNYYHSETHGSNGPLRGYMHSTYEGGLRVPCIMRWQGEIPAGEVCSEIATIMDILPTLAGLIGGKLPENRIDGKDIWSLISGAPGAKSPHEAFFYYSKWALRGVRSGKWKLHMENKDEKTHISLYNLETDIEEKHDLSKEHPLIVNRLQELIKDMRKDLGDSSVGMEGENRRPPGKAIK